jgi:hypothetical protein
VLPAAFRLTKHLRRNSRRAQRRNLLIAAVMSNLYSITKGQQAIRELVRAMRDNAGNMPPRMSSFR